MIKLEKYMSMEGNAIALSHRAPGQDPKQSRWDPLWAALLALPGVAGFSLLVGALVFHSPIAWGIGPRNGLYLWAIAFISAIFSFWYFRCRRKSAGVILCLGLNWFGAIFTVTPPGWIIFGMAFAGA